MCNVCMDLRPCRFSGNKHLPEMVHECNQHMMGVDRMDQMMAYYSFQQKSIKLWRKVFFWLLEVAVNNAHVLYKSHTSSFRKMQLKEFRRELAVQLCQGFVREDSLGYQRMDQSVERLRGRHFPDQGRKRRDCRFCSDRCSVGGRSPVKTFCSTCSDKPALCIGNCLHTYHTRPNLK
jgi:hypothetical protein